MQFKKLLTPGKIGQILCLGNLTDRDTFEFLRQIAPDLQLVKGNFDVDSPNLPLSKVVTHGSLRIGFTHGHTIIPPGDADALLIAARQMDVDILLWGGTHRFEAFEMEGRFFVNPGSATGAFSTGYWPDGEEPTPSFCLMDVSLCWVVWGVLSADFNRSRETFWYCMFINLRPTQAEPKRSPSRKYRFASMAWPPHDNDFPLGVTLLYIIPYESCKIKMDFDFAQSFLSLSGYLVSPFSENASGM